MSPSPSDAALLAALRAGNRDAFERLYSDYGAPIYNLCARVLSDREEAKDLTQEVFITAYGRLTSPAAEPVRKLRPWLYRVATNACYNHLRSRRHLDGGEACIEDAACGVDEYRRAETVAVVEASLAGMNERYRTALVLKDLQGLRAEEIAEVMEVSRPAADVLVHRARSAFKTAFAKLGSEVPAPANLAAALVPLALPAALQAMPPLPAAHVPTGRAPAPHLPIAPHHGVPLPDISTAAGPGAAGLLGKISAALTTKVAIGAAAATLAVSGAVAVRDVEHSRAQHRWQGATGTAWQSAPQKWSKQWAKWSLYSHWMKSGWPMGWNSGHWRWNGRSDSWMWSMKDSTWSWSGGGSSSGSGDGGSWSMTMTRSGSKGWSSGWSGYSSSSKSSGSRSGGSKSGGSWDGSSSGSGSSGSWDGGSSGGSWDRGSSGGSWDGSSGGSGW